MDRPSPDAAGDGAGTLLSGAAWLAALRQNIICRVAIAAGLPLLGVSGLILLDHLDLSAGQGLWPCLFHLSTGLDCIGCGTTRALQALLHGRVLDALSYNVFMLVWLPWPVYALLGEWLRALTGRPVLPPVRDSRPLMLALLISALLFFILRNLPWAPFNWLAA